MRGRKGTRKEGETFGESVIDSLKDFLDAADRGELITVRRVKLNLEPRRYTPAEVKWTRERLRVSQAMFAQLMGVSPKAVEAWESGTNPPSGPVCRLLEEINLDPMAFLQRHLGGSATRKTAQHRSRQMTAR
jgi:DNA-binding transcriptional regulator YiaG